MVKNIFGGKNAKKRAKKFVNNRNATRQIEKKQEDQEYAKLTRKLGDCRFECICSDGITRVAHVAGKFRNRWWFQNEDVVLVSIRFGIDLTKCDILHKYNQNEVEQLKSEGLVDVLFYDDTIDENDLLEMEQSLENDNDNDEIEIDISKL